MRLFTTVLVLLVLTGCASQPDPTAPPPAIAVANATPAASAASAVNAMPTAVGTAPAEAAPKKVPPGYRIVQRDGEELYCTRTATVGSRFTKEICMTENEYVEFEARNESMRQDLRKSTGMCGGGPCSGSQ